jgi:hypothetical protein
MQDYLGTLHEPEQVEKLKLFQYFMSRRQGTYEPKDLTTIVKAKSTYKVEKLLSELQEDLYDNRQEEYAVLDLWQRTFSGFTYSEYERLKQHYLTESVLFQLFHTLLMEKYTTSDAIADALQIKKHTYYTNMRLLDERMQQYGVSVNSKTLKLTGQEHILRFLAGHLYAHYLPPSSDFFEGRYAECKARAEYMFEDMLETYTPLEFHWLSCAYFMVRTRLENDNFLLPTSNQIIRDDIADANPDFYAYISRKLVENENNINVVKLTPEVIKDEIHYMLHIIPLSGLKFKHDISTILKPEVYDYLKRADDTIEMVYNEHSPVPMTPEHKKRLTKSLRIYFATVLATKAHYDFQPTQLFNMDLFRLYPVSTIVGLEMLFRSFDHLLEGATQRQRHIWYSELGNEFVLTVISNLHEKDISPMVNIALEFSHSFNALKMTKKLLGEISGVQFNFVDKHEDADIFITNIARRHISRDSVFMIFYSQLPSLEEWRAIKEDIIAFCSDKYKKSLIF